MISLKNIIRKILFAGRRNAKMIPVYIPVLQNELLKGRNAFITGGSGGIGFAIAEAFLSAGAKVIISGRDKDRLISAASALSSNGSVSFVEMDNRRPDTFAKILDKVGPFDILVNNAGRVEGSSFGTTSEPEYDAVLDTNLKGAYFLSQAVSNRWIAEGTQGNILNICSASSLRPANSPYIISKWGIRSLTIGMAKSLIKHGIVVNGLAPGCTNTLKFSPDGDLYNPKNPSGRLVTVMEIANLAVVLVSALSRMVVGDVVYMTGGGAITTLDD